MNNEKTGEFLVCAITISNDHAIVDGRCLQGQISMGQIFTVISKIETQLSPEGYSPTLRKPIGLVSIKLESISAYERQLTELPEGLTARLELSGADVNQVKTGMSLSIN